MRITNKTAQGWIKGYYDCQASLYVSDDGKDFDVTCYDTMLCSHSGWNFIASVDFRFADEHTKAKVVERREAVRFYLEQM